MQEALGSQFIEFLRRRLILLREILADDGSIYVHLDWKKVHYLIYDMAAIKVLPWGDYRPFVMKLFGVREHPHARYGFTMDGYVGTHSAVLWNYPDHKTHTLDYGC